MPVGGIYIPSGIVRTPPVGGIYIPSGSVRTPPVGGIYIFRQAVFVLRR